MKDLPQLGDGFVWVNEHATLNQRNGDTPTPGGMGGSPQGVKENGMALMEKLGQFPWKLRKYRLV